MRLKTRGLEDTLKHFKSVRLCFTRYLAGQPFQEMEGVPLNTSGFPKVLEEFLPRLNDEQSSIACIKCLMTLLTIGRAMKIKPTLDTESIVTPSKCLSLDFIRESDFRRVCRRLHIRPSCPE